MVKISQRTIVRSVSALKNFPIRHIDPSTITLLSQCIPVKSKRSDTRNTIIALLDCFLTITEQSLTYLALSNRSTISIFVGFLEALSSESFANISDITRDIYIRNFNNALKAMSHHIPNLDFAFDKCEPTGHWMQTQIAPIHREYYEGWGIIGKSGEFAAYLRLAWIWNTLGPETARTLHKAACNFAEKYEARSKNNFVPNFNEFLIHVEKNHPEISIDNLDNSTFTTKLIEEFCRAFFERNEQEGNDQETTIKRWNDALPCLEAVLLESSVFAKPYRPFPYIEPKRKSGAESKLSIDDEGIIVKEKLIIDVPLALTDDQVIELFFKEIDKRVAIVIKWAQEEANSIYNRHKNNGGEYDFMDFDLKPVEIRSKYRNTPLKFAQGAEIAYRFGLPTSFSLEPFMYLLIKEHPQITESFLFTLELYDKHGAIIGIETTDNRTYLVGCKRRRGGKNATQKIALSEKAIILVEQVRHITDPLRNYLREKGDDNYRILFLSCRTGFCYPEPIKRPIPSTGLAFETRVIQFSSLVGDNDKELARDIVNNLTLSRFRATVGLQVYLEAGSLIAMSEALGHAKYKPDLLSHYLPEPILAFFQSRWIRIFQKGIICEAMKDSEFLLRASHFKSTDELHSFLNQHALNLPEDPNESMDKQGMAAKEVCVSVDENVLTALLSLELAVKKADPCLVSAKARFWASFSRLLKVEIIKISYDPEMRLALQNAETKADPSLMQNLIYDVK